MAGGKETPRQKMIGMMYLVLTALLALNVSKEIIRAFVTINDKLDSSAEIITTSTGFTYDGFEKKRLAIQSQKGDTKLIDMWQEKSESLSLRTRQVVHFFLSESNEMIKEAEGGVDWIKEKDEDGLIVELKPFLDISAMDNYDIATNRYIGGNPQKPKKEGFSFRDTMHQYRKDVLEMIGNYSVGEKEYTFEAPESIDGLEAAFSSTNPEDTSFMRQLFAQLTIPEELVVKEAGQEKSMPWPSVMFDHAPIVAAAAMITSLKVDVVNAESSAADYMLSKVEAPSFNFNKIEPLAFARTGYINTGDSLGLSVMIAAYDSNEVSKIRYGINADTLPENWKEDTISKIILPGDKPGQYVVKGQIGVKEKGRLSWKDWNFRYTVGEATGTIALPEMATLYKGYKNQVEISASGYPMDALSLSGSNCSVSRQSGNKYTVTLSNSAKGKATLSLSAKGEDGTTASLIKQEFKIDDPPRPTVILANAQSGDKVSRGRIMQAPKMDLRLVGSPLNFSSSIKSFDVVVGDRKIACSGSTLNTAAKKLVSTAQPGSTVSIINVKYSSNIPSRAVSGAFTIQ